MDDLDLCIRVECNADDCGNDEPRRFWIGRKMWENLAVVDRWIGAENSYYKVRTDDGDIYILRHVASKSRWDMTLYQNGKKLPPLSLA